MLCVVEYGFLIVDIGLINKVAVKRVLIYRNILSACT